MPTFASNLRQAIGSKGNFCSVGLDPDIRLMPEWLRDPANTAAMLTRFGEIVLDSVADLVPVVKPQSAFYEQFGSDGIAALENTIASARRRGLIVLLDVKRGDIGSTSAGYVKAYLEPGGSRLESDAITVSPYLGRDSLAPFARAAYDFGKGLFVCAVTSNPGAADVQKLESGGKPVYEHVAEIVRSLIEDAGDEYSPIGVVAGATHISESIDLRGILPRSVFLVPGLGAQGGSAEHLGQLTDADGMGAIVSSSRSITYPEGSFDTEDRYRAAVREAARDFIRKVAPAHARS